MTQFLADNLGAGEFYNVETFAGSDFEDISSVTNVHPFPISPNNGVYLRELGFDFEFYGEQHSSIAVHTNGVIGFTDDENDLLVLGVNAFTDRFKGDKTPASAEDITLPVVAPLLAAINYSNPDGLDPAPAFYGVRLGAGTAEDRYIVQYTNARAALAPGGSRVAVTFQVALYANGRIEFRYQDIPSSVQEAAKIGISNGNDTNMYEEFSLRGSRLSEADTRIVYTPTSMVNVAIKDAAGETVARFDILDIIDVGEVSGVMELVNREDAYWLGDKSYTAELTSLSPIVVTGTVATYRLIDDDLPEITLEYDMCTTVCDMAEITEGDSLALIARLTNAPGGAPETVTVNLDVLGGTTAGSSEYNLPASVTIDRGASQTRFTVSTTPDDLVELTKELFIGISSVEYGNNQIQSAVSLTLVITDDDPRPTISLDPVASITEGDTRVVTARLLGAALGFPLEVTLVATDISTSSLNDYAIATATMTIPAGSLTADFEVITLVDQLSEEVETFELSLLVPPETVELDVDATRVVAIIEGVLQVSLLSSKEMVIEGQEFEVRLDSMGSSDYDLTIDIATSTAGFDFAQDISSVKFARDDGVMAPRETVTSFPWTFQIMNGARSIILTFEVAEDTVIEADEYFTLEATPSVDYVVIDPNSVEITLSDNRITMGSDLSIIGPTDIAEGETVTIGIELDQPLTQSLAHDLAIDTLYVENVFVNSNFEDISSATGVRVFPTTSNSEAYAETLGFGFRFYTEIYDTIAVHTNGFIGFTDDPDDLFDRTNDSDGYRRDETPAVEGKIVPIIAPLLAAIDPRHHSHIAANDLPNFYGVRLGANTSKDRYIVQYTNARVRVDVGVRVPATFQVALYANGRIELRYQDIPSEVQKVAKIGISNGEGTNMYEEFSYLESRLSETDIRIVYTPASEVNAVIKDADGEVVTDFGILDIIAVDEVSGTIQLVNRDREDTNWDGDQVYTVELVSNTPLVVVTGTVATYKFTDDDLPEVTLEYVCTTVCARAEVAESDSLPLVVRLINVAPTGAPEAVTVNLVALDGTATEILDYTLPASVTIAEGTSQAIFTFSPTDDNLAERTEDLTIGISSIEYGDNEIQSDVRLELFITDDDPRPPISLDPVEPTIEGDTLVVTARLDATLGFPLDVTLIATDISASSPTDYYITESTMTIPAGSLTADFEIVTVFDMSREETEEFELNLQVPPETVGLDVDATRVVTILDGVILVNLSSSENSVLEGQEFEIRLDPEDSSDYDLTIDIATSTAGFDFAQDITSVKFARDDGVLGPQETVTSFPHTFQIMSDIRSIIVTFEVTSDREIEADESFTLRATSSMDYVVIDPNTVEVTLSDYIVAVDVSVIGPTDIAEGEAVTIGIELDRPLTQSLADNLVINTSYQEYVFGGSNFEDISSEEGVRAFSIASNSEAYSQELGFDFQFYTEIYDTIAVHTNGLIGFTDDPDDVLDGANASQSERDKTPAIEGKVVPIVAPLLSPINYFNPDGLDPAPAFYGVRLGAGTDEDRYIVQYTNARVRVAAGVRVLTTFQVVLYADGRIELRYQDIPSEVQRVAKIGISNGEGTNMYEEFSYTESRLSESDTRIVYTPASRANAVVKDVDGETVTDFGILDIVTVDEVSGAIRLVNRSREDTNWDGDQAYTVELVSASPLVVPTGTVVSYTFTDDDLPEVTLDYVCTAVCARAEVTEGASLNLIVGLTNPAPTGALETVTVNLEILGGTATENLDYTLPASITIAENTTQTIFTFSPTKDDLAERTEELVIGISSVEYGDNRLQSGVSFVVFITDNDPRPRISLDPVEPIIEGETRVVTARLDDALGFSLPVTLIATDISANSLVDYAIATATLTIPAGSLTADFEVVTIVDQLSEELETFELSLQVPSEMVVLDVDATRVVRILDGAHLVNFARAEEMVLEGQELKVRLDAKGLLGYDLTIDIANSTAGFDFAQDITSVKFAQGRGEDVLGAQEETVTLFPQTFAIMSSARLIELTFEVANDTEIEPGESFTLEATSPNGYVTIDSNTVEVTLRDYIVAVDLSVIGPTDIPEGEMVTIGIELDRPLTRFLADNLGAGVSYPAETFADSNFENVTSLIADVRFPNSSNNEAYLQPLGFDFEFYGETYSNIAVHTNGFVGFTDDANDLLDVTNAFLGRNRGDETPAIPGKVVPIVAPLLSAIDPRPHSYLASRDHPNFYGVHLGAGTAEERYIVQYDRSQLNEQPGGPRVVATFQVALYANGRIEFRYKDIPGAAQEAAKIGISDGTGTGRYEEFSYLESKLGESDVRIVYTPVPVANVVIKDTDGEAVTSFDIRDIITVDGVRGTIELDNEENTDWDGTRTYTAELDSALPLIVPGTVATYTFH